MKKLVVAGRSDRLGARVKNALAAHDFARRIDADFLLAWDPEDHVADTGIAFSELFDAKKFTDATGIRVIEREAKATALQQAKSKRNLLSDFRDMSDQQITSSSERVIHYKLTTTRPAEDKVAFVRMASVFRSWPLNPSVLECLSSLLKDEDVHQWIAVHLRRGDILDALLSPSFSYRDHGIELSSSIQNFVARFAPLSSYINAINECHPDAKIAVFSDDETAVSELIDHFPDRAVSVASLIKPYRLTPSQEAIVEFCLLSRFPKIVGTSSAFSKVPAELSAAHFLDVRRYITSEHAINALDEIFLRSRAANRDEIWSKLREAYAWHFKKTGKVADFERMSEVGAPTSVNLL